MPTWRPPTEIFGHTCEGLRAFQEASTSPCIPFIEPDGTVSGCDGTNRIALTHCPMCGELWAIRLGVTTHTGTPSDDITR